MLLERLKWAPSVIQVLPDPLDCVSRRHVPGKATRCVCSHKPSAEMCPFLLGKGICFLRTYTLREVRVDAEERYRVCADLEGTRYNPSLSVETHNHRGGGIMVRVEISLGGRPELRAIHEDRVRHWVRFLYGYCHPCSTAIGYKFILMDDNPRAMLIDCLQCHSLERMGAIWGYLDRHVGGSSSTPRPLHKLQQGLLRI
ncbi:hypothetical protein TNCV_4231241 [Trichonephila clavipes]|uniref:Uncharacterized protein n=1 Tax=Trichonephila clavipes TaxID=2585209 RepID=A0A8X6SI68_TRICX|nr:hypothetical protein TNCV_4231241 [Trichonephila clavipes]